DSNVFITGRGDTSPDGDYVTLAYSSSGVLLWANSYNGPANNIDESYALAVDSNGNVFVTGGSLGAGDPSWDYATIKYSSSVRPYLSIQKVNDQVVLTWSNSAFNLQTAPTITGTFTNIIGATSPYTNSIIDPHGYFRPAAP